MKKEELKHYLPALALALRHKDTPKLAKVFATITVGYALSPIDLVPDFIPVLGYLDDLIILPLLVTLTIRFIPSSILNECLEQSKDLWKSGKPKQWKYAIPIILLYSIIIIWVMKLIFH